MKIVIKTQTNELKANDKILVPGRKSPVVVKSVNGNGVKFSGGIATGKLFERVIERSADIIR